MNPRVKQVFANSDFSLKIIFSNNEVKYFNMLPYLNTGVFKELKNINIFKQVKPFHGSIQWPNGQDLCPDTLYLESIPIQIEQLHSK